VLLEKLNGFERGRWAETLRLNNTATSLDLCNNGLGEGGGRWSETLRINTTFTSLDRSWQQ
jgi:hypothetical protein